MLELNSNAPSLHHSANTIHAMSNHPNPPVWVRNKLSEGLVIPACPLALNARRKLDERRQRALFRYYLAAGAGGLAVGVHTTQFAIRDPKVGLFRPVLELAANELRKSRAKEAHSSKSEIRNPKLISASLPRLLQELESPASAAKQSKRWQKPR